MGGEQITGAVLAALVCLVGGLVLYYCGVRWSNSKTKTFGIALAVMPAIAWGLYFGLEWLHGEPEYRTAAQGPERRQSVVTTEVAIPVTNGAVMHRMEMTAKISGADHTSAATHLVYKLRTPGGEVVAQGEQDAAPTDGFRWVPLVVDFQPRGEGQYLLSVDIRQPVSRVDIVVREMGK